MPRIQYRWDNVPIKYRPIIEQANDIARTYAMAGDSLTLRQLYYQFVARALIANKDTEYKRLGNIINVARYAGLFDWSSITDLTRNVRGGDGAATHPSQVLRNLGFYAAIWEGQTKRVEVWVEKDALVNVIARSAGPLRTPYFSCRGYTSASEVWAAAQRIERYLDTDGVDDVLIIHLGDHDPSGIDMSRDIEARLTEFLSGDGYDESRLTVDRIALNMDQIDQYGPPPNPAKITDSRAQRYIAQYGDESWELDALEPAVLRALVTDRIQREIEPIQWQARIEFQQRNQAVLDAFSKNYDKIAGFLEDNDLVDLSPVEDPEED